MRERDEMRERVCVCVQLQLTHGGGGGAGRRAAVEVPERLQPLTHSHTHTLTHSLSYSLCSGACACAALPLPHSPQSVAATGAFQPDTSFPYKQWDIVPSSFRKRYPLFRNRLCFRKRRWGFPEIEFPEKF
jgi:hypothetical protein